MFLKGINDGPLLSELSSEIFKIQIHGSYPRLTKSLFVILWQLEFNKHVLNSPL